MRFPLATTCFSLLTCEYNILPYLYSLSSTINVWFIYFCWFTVLFTVHKFYFLFIFIFWVTCQVNNLLPYLLSPTGNSCYYSVQTFLSSRILSKNLKIKTYKTIILPVVLYGCETWSLTLREECRLRVFENRILRRIFGPKRDKNGDWRRLHNEELHNFYRSCNVV